MMRIVKVEIATPNFLKNIASIDAQDQQLHKLKQVMNCNWFSTSSGSLNSNNNKNNKNKLPAKQLEYFSQEIDIK